MNCNSLNIDNTVQFFLVPHHHNPPARIKEKKARNYLDVNDKLIRQVVAIQLPFLAHSLPDWESYVEHQNAIVHKIREIVESLCKLSSF